MFNRTIKLWLAIKSKISFIPQHIPPAYSWSWHQFSQLALLASTAAAVKPVESADRLTRKPGRAIFISWPFLRHLSIIQSIIINTYYNTISKTCGVECGVAQCYQLAVLIEQTSRKNIVVWKGRTEAFYLPIALIWPIVGITYLVSLIFQSF